MNSHKESEKLENALIRTKYVIPECCQDMLQTAAIFLDIPSDFYEETKTSQQPKWVVKATAVKYEHHYEAKYCPYCATPVPQIQPRSTTRKICTCIDGGYYCNTCRERLNCCACLPPAFAWQPIDSTRSIPLTGKEIIDLIIEYSEAQQHANDDMSAPSRLTVFDKKGTPCTISMARARNAYVDLMEQTIDTDPIVLPKDLTDFIAADKDKGCSSCWLSSNKIRNHPECNAKITNWFKAREALVKFGQEIKKVVIP